jgi:membrane AbrB-like protein
MLAGILFSLGGVEIRIPKQIYTFSKGLLGVRIALTIEPGFWSILQASWLYLLGGTLWAMVASAALGVWLTRARIFPGTTAIWALSPGGANIMTILSADYGANPRLVGFCQYTRVVMVSLAAIVVSRFWVTQPTQVTATLLLFPDLWVWIALGIGALSILVEAKSRVPAGATLIPMVVAVLVRNLGEIPISLPFWILTPAFAIIGWQIGLGFSRAELKRAFHSLHYILSAILLMIVFSGLFAVVMVFSGSFDPLTAYLATSPGGMDAVVIIASGTEGDLSYITASQALRMILVIIVGPWLAKFCLRFAGQEF